MRAKATLAAVVVVGAALAVGGFGLVSLLGRSLEEGVESSARAQVADVASLVSSGRLPSRLAGTRGDTFTQVVDVSGRVVSASDTLAGETPFSHLHPGSEGLVMVKAGHLAVQEAERDQPDAEGPYLILAKAVVAPPLGPELLAPLTVYVAASLRPGLRVTTLVTLALVAGLPVLVMLVGAMVWLLSGRALRPVEAIRAEVADISGHDLRRRVPEPRARDEVGRLAVTMNQMLDRLESSAAHRRRFVADASHELRSPLTGLQATLEVALAHPEGASWDAVANDALEEARRLHRLVEDLLVLARSDEQTLVPEARIVDLDELVRGEAGRLRARRRVPVDLSQVGSGFVVGDPDQLTRVLHNLLDNAERHASSSVTVSLRTADERVVVEVADDGPGIPAEARERIFERFARLDEARSESDGGAGLGLAIVREIVESHGGSIVVAETSSGACFVVELPRAEHHTAPD